MLASAGQQRTRATPEVPTMAEAGVPGYDLTSWFAVMVPAGTPPAVIRRLQQESEIVLKPGTPHAGKVTDVELAASPPEQVAQRIESEFKVWRQVLRAAGIKPEI